MLLLKRFVHRPFFGGCPCRRPPPRESDGSVRSGRRNTPARASSRDGEGSIVRGQGEKLLPEALLVLPEVGSLPGEGGAMHFAEGGEPLAVMTPEVTKDGVVGVEPKNSPTNSMVRTSASESLSRDPEL